MFNLALPWMLILIPLPLLIRWLMPAAKGKNTTILVVPFFKRLQEINQSGHDPFFRLWNKKLILPFIIWILLCITVARPEWLGDPLSFPETGRDIMLALDLSGSMQITDMELNGHYFDRLSVVKNAARKFIRARTGDRLGLILFGTRAYLQTPLTFDQTTVLQMLNDATIGLAGTQTAIGEALGLALKQLNQVPGKSKVIILLTDGGNNAGMVSPLDAAKMAAQMGIKIYTIGLGAKRLIVPGIFGMQVIHPTSSLDENTLKEIALVTHGLFFRADNGSELEKVYQEIDRLVPADTSSMMLRPIDPLYPWPLGLALLLSFYLIAVRIIYFFPAPRGETP